MSIFNTPRPGDIVESGMKNAQAIQDDAAIDIALFKARIEPNCSIEVDKC